MRSERQRRDALRRLLEYAIQKVVGDNPQISDAVLAGVIERVIEHDVLPTASDITESDVAAVLRELHARYAFLH